MNYFEKKIIHGKLLKKIHTVKIQTITQHNYIYYESQWVWIDLKVSFYLLVCV
jgi:hypothetical protein